MLGIKNKRPDLGGLADKFRERCEWWLYSHEKEVKAANALSFPSRSSLPFSFLPLIRNFDSLSSCLHSSPTTFAFLFTFTSLNSTIRIRFPYLGNLRS